MNHRKILILTLIGAGITFVFLRLLPVPLGIPGEWVWPRVQISSEDLAGLVFGLIYVALSLLVFLAVCFSGVGRIDTDSLWKKMLLLCCLCASGYVWLINLQDSLPISQSLAKSPFVIYYPASSGYYHEARYQIKETGEFLKTYESKMSEGDVLHVGTHPPGLFLFHKGLLELCEVSPSLSGMILNTVPDSAMQAMEAIQSNEANSGVKFDKAGQAALWLSVMLTHVLALLTIIPLFLICEKLTDSAAAWRTVCFWPLIPALAVFLPKSDAIYPFFCVLILYLWTLGLLNRSYLHSFLAGVVLFLSLCFSLAVIPAVALCGFIFAGWCYRERQQKNLSLSLLLQPLGVLAGLAVCIGLAWLVGGINLVSVWKWNYVNHAGFYEQFTRTWWKWLLVNPLELLFALGIPVVILCWVGVTRIRKQGKWDMPSIFTCSILLTWALLWLSGKNSGEAARLWLFLMPWFLIITGFCWYHFPKENGKESSRESLTPIWRKMLCLEILTCVVTVFSVFGFDYLK